MSSLKERLKKQKWKVFGALVILIVIALVLNQKQTSFEEGFKTLEKLDARYNTNYHNERLNKTMIDLEFTDPIIEDIEKWEKKWTKEENTTDTRALLLFTNIRKNMITSQKFWRLGEEFGSVGRAGDGFRCNEEPFIINAAYYYNQSWVKGLDAQLKLDTLLYEYREVRRLRELVGIDNAKSPLRDIKNIAVNNIALLELHCGYDKTKPLLIQRIK